MMSGCMVIIKPKGNPFCGVDERHAKDVRGMQKM
jgi:hypothetical protein